MSPSEQETEEGIQHKPFNFFVYSLIQSGSTLLEL